MTGNQKTLRREKMEKEIGAEGKLKASMVDGKIKLEVAYDGKQLDAGAYISSDSDALIDAIGGLIPGDSAFEKGALALLKVALKNVNV